MSNAGGPGALAASAVDGAARTCQRVTAALGAGATPTRTTRVNTPDRSTRSASRRVAVRSNRGEVRHGWTTRAPMSGQRVASPAAHSVAAMSAAWTTTNAAGSRPRSAMPLP